jgi:hypothetical protein
VTCQAAVLEDAIVKLPHVGRAEVREVETCHDLRPSILRPIYFFAALIFAQRAFCAAAILLRTEADTLRRGLTPLFPETLPAFSARIFAQRARVAAIIRSLPAADRWRLRRDVVSVTFCTDTSGPVAAVNSARTCWSLEILARTSLTMLSLLNVFPRVEMRP